MKNIIILTVSFYIFLSCKKETSSQSQVNLTITKPTDMSTDTSKYITDGVLSIGKPIGKIGEGVTDIDGNKYRTVIIGKQEWMAENLKTTRYAEGPFIRDVTQPKSASNCIFYNYNDSNNIKYGKLYSWYSVYPYNHNGLNLCPTGWHVPSDGEWLTLVGFLGGINEAARKMKDIDTLSWYSPNIISNNVSLFSALPGGFYSNDGYFSSIGKKGYWWSTTSYSGNAARCIVLDENIYNVNITIGKKLDAFSVRCIKD
jgi:uncharacterized protein (TIGR02145 family)